MRRSQLFASNIFKPVVRLYLRVMTDAPAPSPAPPEPSGKHIVDVLIEERAPRLMQRPRLWRAIQSVLYPALGYRRAVALADEIAPRPGPSAMDWTESFLQLRVQPWGLDAIPSQGGCVVVANHPGGIADGVAVWAALRQRRPDLCFFANRDALRVCPGLADIVLPVEWRTQSRRRDSTRETLRAALSAFRDGRCVVIFPAGRMAEWSWKRWGLKEKPWLPTAISLARRFDAPVIPLGVRQRMPFLYYALAQVSDELKDMTVFQGFMDKRRARYKLTFGTPVDPKSLPANEGEATEILRQRCEELAWR